MALRTFLRFERNSWAGYTVAISLGAGRRHSDFACKAVPVRLTLLWLLVSFEALDSGTCGLLHSSTAVPDFSRIYCCLALSNKRSCIFSSYAFRFWALSMTSCLE